MIRECTLCDGAGLVVMRGEIDACGRCAKLAEADWKARQCQQTKRAA